MRTEKVTYYYCDYCNQEYSTKADALKCEHEHTRETTDPNGSKPKYHTGDFVYEAIGVHRWYFILGENWKPYWDAKKRCWVYSALDEVRGDIPEPDLRLAMPASEYSRRVQDIKDKLGEDYTVDIRHYVDCVGFSVELELKQKGEQK